nr:MAG TPA: hypothetical protein [Caudoviricetes sp.]DAO55746.1 MAG TPA: hypothetical protein [Caudoviricetes sp.]
MVLDHHRDPYPPFNRRVWIYDVYLNQAWMY